jgi:peptidoglycan hydrolase CwlO-like protein
MEPEIEDLIAQIESFHVDLQELQEEVSLLKFEKEELEIKVNQLEEQFKRPRMSIL